MREVRYKPIGIIHSPFRDAKGMPIQPTGARGVTGTVEILPEYCAGLRDMGGFSHIILIYHFHLSKQYSLEVRPYMDTNKRGVFATRIPGRPNPLGISVVRLIKVEGCTLHIQDVDILDSTPLLDIKPYVPEFDVRKVERTGWLSKRSGSVYGKRSDGRFI
ncbi:MAG: tRNA (N6-threonylcarbamoyladenosine(37)-N6)-methyltransferase TrmO [Candidatus Altiarchaeales archaeon ex4484_2]|nr:MAG: tRNA (N6-threonylcarbamoyladenosine(37)-N6)-methyltransferase TrmO [Candidatus Altiarchaeales archaeon ex4484_2]